MTEGHVPVSIVVPTIGRIGLLTACLGSIDACKPRPAEVVVVDQSGGDEVEAIVQALGRSEFRSVVSEPRGIAHATNLGLESARNDYVLVTHDDCTVDPSWVSNSWRLMKEEPGRMVTGRVLPAGEGRYVPSTIDVPVAQDYVHGSDFSVLFPNNMGMNRSAVLRFGGFDERIPYAAEDNDFCYRWLRAGRPLRYEPTLVVWHHDWRTEDELERMYVRYAIGQGFFYAKHLRQGDLRIARHLLYDLYMGARGLLAPHLLHRPRSSDWRQGVLRGLPVGLVRGLRLFPSQPRPAERQH